MIKVERIEVFNIEGAIRGMRNPLESWSKSDSYYGCSLGTCYGCHEVCGRVDHNYIVGANDLDLMRRLYKGGSEHRKYLRQIFVSMDTTAPRFFYTEMDTYQVGTAKNSCSTMHTIHKKPFVLSDFSFDEISSDNYYTLELCGEVIKNLNRLRELYLETNDKKYWRMMIELLPQSYNQRRTITMNYENVMNMINQREHHKLDCWREFVKILRNLPYIQDIRSEC